MSFRDFLETTRIQFETISQPETGTTSASSSLTDAPERKALGGQTKQPPEALTNCKSTGKVNIYIYILYIYMVPLQKKQETHPFEEFTGISAEFSLFGGLNKTYIYIYIRQPMGSSHFKHQGKTHVSHGIWDSLGTRTTS